MGSDVMRAAMGEPQEGGPDRRWISFRAGVTLAIFVVGTAIATVIALKTGNIPFLAEQNAQAQDSASDKVDASKPPFNVTVTPAYGEQNPGTSWEIDRRLTPAEEAELRTIPASIDSADRVWKFVRKAGGRRTDGDANGYRFQFTSERQAAVSITDFYAKAGKCWPSRAKTYISLEQGGWTGWEEAYFDLDSKRSFIPLLQGTTQDSRAGLPLKKKISLGGNETPADLKVLPSSTTQSCNWSLELVYNVAPDPESKKQTVSKDAKGNDLIFNGPYAADADVWGPAYSGNFEKDRS
ncbi:hypothetical protein [Streptomyces phaeochromogenes]|uniref:hypothetical protein n=1 Tax=Streptomyces phaeochromogenes TaxID=1923 RepID=UPI00368840D4